MKKKKINKSINKLNKAALHPYNYDDVFVFLVDTNEILKISEGTGDNFLKEDIEAGYVDYICYKSYDMDDYFNEDAGGEILLTEYFKDKYYCTAACVDDVMKFIEYEGKYILLSQSYHENKWYKEVWTDEDIAQALSDNGIVVNNNNISQIRNRAKYIFDDKSYRCEKLSDLISEIFAVED